MSFEDEKVMLALLIKRVEIILEENKDTEDFEFNIEEHLIGTDEGAKIDEWFANHFGEDSRKYDINIANFWIDVEELFKSKSVDDPKLLKSLGKILVKYFKIANEIKN